MTDDLSRYVEDTALLFESLGIPRMAGRILGLLLVCDPPHRTSTELVRELSASKASISEMTRMLVTFGLLERFARPGERSNYFRVRDDGFEMLFEQEMKTIAAFGNLAEQGLAVIGDNRERGQRLRALRAFYRFWEEALPDLAARWRDERDARIAAEP